MTSTIRAAIACGIVATLAGCSGRNAGAGELGLAVCPADMTFGTSLGASPPEQTRVVNAGT